MMQIFNTLPPSIEPRATGHIPEQIEMVEAIMKTAMVMKPMVQSILIPLLLLKKQVNTANYQEGD